VAAQTAPPGGPAAEERAASEVLQQLNQATQPLAPSQIPALEKLGPPPWLAMGTQRSPKVVEAWTKVMEQLPVDKAASNRHPRALTYQEKEAAGKTGANDTPATGERIKRLGTGPEQARTATIRGNLSGAEVRPPFPFDCTSTEDDGSIPTANPTPVIQLTVAVCGGVIGDGPYGQSTGDIDLYSFGQVDSGFELVVDVAQIALSLQPVDAFIGIYDPAGNLVASGHDSGDPNSSEFLQHSVTTPGVYYAAVAGCCKLGSNPFNSASGPGAGPTGTYEMFLVAIPPPCLSVEDDGSIPQANKTQVGAADFDFCTGVIGDGPFGATSGDGDFYRVDGVQAGELIVADVVRFGDEADPVDAAVGVYDAAGHLLTSVQQAPGDPEVVATYEAATAGDYHVQIAGRLNADPFNSGSGPGVGDTGTYNMALVVTAPPCLSVEDDGSIGQANDASRGQGDDTLFVTFCTGQLGDGPHAAAGGDLDFFTTRQMQAGKVLVVDFSDIDGTQAASVGIAQSIDPGNTDTTETAVVLLDLLSGPAADSISLNHYPVAAGRTRTQLIGTAVGNVAAHEAGHLLGSWHTDTFNGVVSLMDAGGELESIFQVGPDAVFGTADDVDPGFAEDVFNRFEGFSGLEDTAGRTAFGFSTGQQRVPVRGGRDA
jgi:hypothetical protein